MLQLESEFLGQIGPPQARCQPWSPCWNFAGIPLMPFKPHFPKFPHLEFMCLVHEPENTYFWYENELIFVSFHELYWSGNGSFGFLAVRAKEERSNN